MPKSSIYVETSIVSYLVGWLNQRDLAVAHNQQMTREWWSRRRTEFDLYISPVVVDEARKGETSLASQRLEYLAPLPVLEVTPEAKSLSRDLLRLTRIPRNAELDSLHISIAAVTGMNYLLTWNCRHIANAEILPKVYEVCRSAGYEPPFVCTPLELLGVSHG
ncbi:MAG TPA: type II toxin-antitoxin system VapC family toxin [Thermoanaerobaculia bacterium]|nr:type II toxin-antitoxin system VapC family toxin [Thermoanaerobaculia bacterium]